MQSSSKFCVLGKQPFVVERRALITALVIFGMENAFLVGLFYIKRNK